MGGLDPAWIALIGTLCGGIGLKLLEHWLGKSKVKVDEASKIRDELRLEISSLREEVTKLEKEVNDWRSKYLDMRDEFSKLNTQYMIEMAKIGKKIEETQNAIDFHPTA